MGESARKPGAPTLPLTPQELLTTGANEGFTLYDRYAVPAFVALVAALMPAVGNWQRRRPVFAGLTFVTAKWVNDSRLAQRSEKDAMLLHYISLHPEDFPPFERQRFKDVFEPWSPKR